MGESFRAGCGGRVRPRLMLKLLRENVHSIVQAAYNPALFCSFGKDSLLLLALAREIRPSIGIIWLRENLLPSQRAFAERYIIANDLKVLNFAPVARQMVATANGLSLLNGYSLNSDLVNSIHDCLPSSERCILDLCSPAKGLPVTLPYDVLLTGQKASDGHELASYGDEIGGIPVKKPLWEYSDTEVRQMLMELGISVPSEEEADTSTLIACTNCLIDASLPCWKRNGTT